MIKIIENIFEQEERASNLFQPDAFAGLRSPESQRAAARWLLLRAGPPRLGNPVEGEWGIYSRNAPVLCELLHQPTLIVDIHTQKGRPNPAECFENEYGVTPDQMAVLVDAGLVIPNLYESENPWDYEAPHLRPLFRSPDRWIVNAVRLKSLRAYLQQTIPSDLSDYPDYTLPILKLVDESDEADLVSLYGRQDSKEGRKKKVEANWNYLHEFGANTPELSTYLLEFRERARKGVLTFGDIEDLFAVKLWFTTPVTAAFGGTHNVAPSQLRAIFRSEHLRLHRLNWRKEQRRLFEEFDPGLKFLFDELSPLFAADGEKRLGLPVPKDERGVINFIAFLKDYRPLIRQAEIDLGEIYSIGKDQDYSMRKACDWAGVLAKVKNAARELESAGHYAEKAVEGGALAAFAGLCGGGENALFVGGTALVSGWISVLATRKLSSLWASKRKLVADFDQLESAVMEFTTKRA